MTDLTPEALAEIHALVADIFTVSAAEVAAAPSKCIVPWSDWRGHAGHDPFNCRLVLAVEKVAAYRQSVLADAEAEIARLRAENDDARGALSEWRTGRMADATGHRFTCSKIEGTWACDKGCAVAERDKLRAENVELQNGLDGYARQLEARKAEIAERDALIGRLVEALSAVRKAPCPESDNCCLYEVSREECHILDSPALAPWRKA